MFKKMLMIAVLAMVALSPVAMAEEMIKGLGTDYLTGKNNARTGEVELSILGGGATSSTLSDSGYGELGLSVGLLPQFAIGGSLGYRGDSVSDQTNVDAYAPVGYIDFILRLPLDQWPLVLVSTERGWWDSFVPYVKWSVGQAFVGVNNNSTQTAGVDRFDSDNVGASRFAVGLDWFVNNNVALFVEHANHSTDALNLDGSFTLNGKDVDFDVFGGGLKVVF